MLGWNEPFNNTIMGLVIIIFMGYRFIETHPCVQLESALRSDEKPYYSNAIQWRVSGDSDWSPDPHPLAFSV